MLLSQENILGSGVKQTEKKLYNECSLTKTLINMVIFFFSSMISIPSEVNAFEITLQKHFKTRAEEF